MKKVVVILAPGFEEIEAVSIIDVLRRAGAAVTVAALGDSREVCGSHGIPVLADVPLAAVDAAAAEMVVLPGGMPGSVNLARSEAVVRLLQAVSGRGGLVAAICAAPLALAAAGLLAGRKYTCYPGVEKEIGLPGFTGSRVEEDGPVVTGQSAGAALEFSLALVSHLRGPALAASLRQSLMMK